MAFLALALGRMPAGAAEPVDIAPANLAGKTELGCAAGYGTCNGLSAEEARVVLGYDDPLSARLDYRDTWTSGPPPEGDARERAVLACAAGENRCYDDGLVFTETELQALLGFASREEAKLKLDAFDAYLERQKKKPEDGFVYEQDGPVYLSDYSDPFSMALPQDSDPGRIELACLEVGCRGRLRWGEVYAFSLGLPETPITSSWPDLMASYYSDFMHVPAVNGEPVPAYVGGEQRILDAAVGEQYGPLGVHDYVVIGPKAIVLADVGAHTLGTPLAHVGFRKSTDKPRLLNDEDFQLSGKDQPDDAGDYEHVEIPPEIGMPNVPAGQGGGGGGSAAEIPDRTRCFALERWIMGNLDRIEGDERLADILETAGYPDNLSQDEEVCEKTSLLLDLVTELGDGQARPADLKGVWIWSADPTPAKGFTVEMEVDRSGRRLSGTVQVLAYEGGCPDNDMGNDLCKLVNDPALDDRQYRWTVDLPPHRSRPGAFEGASALDVAGGVHQRLLTSVIPGADGDTLSLGLFTQKDGESTRDRGGYYTMVRKDGGLASIDAGDRDADACTAMDAMLSAVIAEADTDEVQRVQAILVEAHVRYNPSPSDAECADAIDRLEAAGIARGR